MKIKAKFLSLSLSTQKEIALSAARHFSKKKTVWGDEMESKEELLRLADICEIGHVLNKSDLAKVCKYRRQEILAARA